MVLSRMPHACAQVNSSARQTCRWASACHSSCSSETARSSVDRSTKAWSSFWQHGMRWRTTTCSRHCRQSPHSLTYSAPTRTQAPLQQADWQLQLQRRGSHYTLLSAHAHISKQCGHPSCFDGGCAKPNQPSPFSLPSTSHQRFL